MGQLEEVHNAVHRDLKCQMENEDTASYDPVFWMHHAFIDKLIADWQNIPGNYDERVKLNRNVEKMEPFNLEHNHYQDFTNISSYDTWDYKDKLCYEYCPRGTNCPIHGASGSGALRSTGSQSASSRSTGLYIFTASVAVVLPTSFGGTLKLQHCYSENDCQTSDFPSFGKPGIECDQHLTVNKKNFVLHEQLYNYTEK